MARPTATVVIPAWNSWEYTRACLESLRPTLGVRDEVVVVDNGSVDATPAGLRRYPWARVVTNAENLGFAAGCNRGAAGARGDVVVFLNTDTLVAGRWLDDLLEPFADPGVGATGPRSNFVSGAQLVEAVPYDPTRLPELRRFAREWRDAHRGQVDEVQRLVGFCLAVRRSAYEAVGGFDEGFGIGGYEDDDLCARLVGAGWRLLVASASFVHHHGHKTFEGNGLDFFEIQQENEVRFRRKHRLAPRPAAPGGARTAGPLLSACMIVRDEEETLPACLEGLHRVVDEVVVYDTGSTDGTVALARAAGARVVEGYWDDDFGRARNAALAECRGRWVLHVDADEVVEGDAAALRGTLESPTSPDGLVVEIVNLTDGRDTATYSHQACRLFRRGRGRWVGRLHEQVTTPEGRPIDVGLVESVRIVHSGYRDEAMRRKDKVERNLRVAEAAARGEEGNRAEALLNLGRSLAAAGRHGEALARYVAARGQRSWATVERMVLRSGAETLLTLGRPQEALEWVEALEARSKRQEMVRLLRGVARLNLGDAAGALANLDGLGEVRDDEGITYASNLVRLRQGLAYAAGRRWDEAADALLDAVRGSDVAEAVWVPMVEAFSRTGRDLGPVAAAVPTVHLTAVLAQVLFAPPAGADELGERLWERHPGDPRLLAFAIRLAPALPLERGLEWSARLRGVGLDEHCPLAALALDRAAEPARRVEAAALVAAAFDDPRARTALAGAAPAVPEERFEGLLVLLDEVAPLLLEPFVLGAASTPGRCLALGRLLHRFGAEEEAVAVVAHGAAQGAGAGVADEIAAWLAEVGAGAPGERA